MQLSRKQVILIVAVSGVILLLTLAAVLLFASGEADTADEAPVTPPDTVPPTATAAPEITPSPTPFRLPLVPQDTSRPTAPTDTGSPTGTGPWAGAGGERTQDILAVGLREGRTAALLWQGPGAERTGAFSTS